MIKKVMIVDDSTTARSIVRRSLEICGLQNVEFEEAANGREAIEKLKKSRVDLVFTDLNMPEMDGEQLLKRMKSSPKLVDIPVVVITSMSNPKRKNELLQENASKIIAKPISQNEIQEYLDQNVFSKQEEIL